MLCSIPIYAVMVENLGERGAEYLALKMLRDEIKSETSQKSQKSQKNNSEIANSTSSNYSTALIVALAAGVGIAVGTFLAKKN